MNVCWSLKGGAGTTVVAAGMAIAAARSGGRPLVLDLAGDLPAVLGVDGAGPGVTDWCAAVDAPGPEALDRLAVDVPGGARLVALGAATIAILVTSWATGTDRITRLFDRVLNSLIDKVG
jgi:hypothetical protein